jgi:NTP pyrophosphatase (non-canonical NTP hydrolase)
MTIADYYKWVGDELKNNKNADDIVDIFNYVTGMTEECGEILEIIYSNHSHSKIDRNLLKDESGDFLWYAVAYHNITVGNVNEFVKFISKANNTDKFMEIHLLIYGCTKFQGMYRKKLFLGKEVNDKLIDDMFEENFIRFMHILSYFKLFLSDVYEHNVNKLNERYPEGRTSLYYIELKKTLKNEKN